MTLPGDSEISSVPLMVVTLQVISMSGMAKSIARFVEKNLPEEPIPRQQVVNVFQQVGAANSASSSGDGGDRAPRKEEEDGAQPAAQQPNLTPRVRLCLRRLTLRIILIGAVLLVAALAWWWGE